MKRAHSGELPTTQNETPHLNAAPTDDQTPAQPPGNRAPQMQARMPNITLPDMPTADFDPDAPLPDWDVLEQMFHTPPYENRRDRQAESASSANHSEKANADWSSSNSEDDHSEDLIDKQTKRFIAKPQSIFLHNYSIRELSAALERCKRDPKITSLGIMACDDGSSDAQEAAQLLNEFFQCQQSIRQLSIMQMMGRTPIVERLLPTLFGNQGLSHLELQSTPSIPISPEEGALITDSIKRNDTLKSLKVMSFSDSRLCSYIAEGLVNNSNLQELRLSISDDANFCQSLAAHLKSNQQLSKLSLSGCIGRTSPLPEILLSAVRDSATLTELDMRLIYFDTPIERKYFEPLIGNQGLKKLHLPRGFVRWTTDGIEVVSDLLRNHPALTTINLGFIPNENELLVQLARGLKSNTKLTSLTIAIPPLSFERKDHFSWFISGGTKTNQNTLAIEFMKMLDHMPSLVYIGIEQLDDLGTLSYFLERNPQIREVYIPQHLIDSETLNEEILSIVKRFGQIKKLQTLPEGITLPQGKTPFDEDLERALWINRQIENNLGGASVAMLSFLNEKLKTEKDFPGVPWDITNALAAAIARHVPPEKAKAIFDELIVHGPEPKS